jgi:hypothetical protein
LGEETEWVAAVFGEVRDGVEEYGLGGVELGHLYLSEGGRSIDLEVYPCSTTAHEADAGRFREEDVVDVRHKGAV